MKVLLTRRAAEGFEELPVLIKVRVLKIFGRLQTWPAVSGARPLRGRLAGQFRMRTGDYRVQFYVEEDQVTVVKVGHRDRFYDE